MGLLGAAEEGADAWSADAGHFLHVKLHGAVHVPARFDISTGVS